MLPDRWVSLFWRNIFRIQKAKTWESSRLYRSWRKETGHIEQEWPIKFLDRTQTSKWESADSENGNYFRTERSMKVYLTLSQFASLLT
jgi:hypothetical protein